MTLLRKCYDNICVAYGLGFLLQQAITCSFIFDKYYSFVYAELNVGNVVIDVAWLYYVE